MKTMYFKSAQVAQTYLPSNPEEDFGFDYDLYDTTDIIGKRVYLDAGLVSIDKMIEKLQEMKQAGANYASIDWHCDHQEYDIYGIQYDKASDEEVEEHKANIEKRKEAKKNSEIAELEKKLASLKNN